MYEDLIGVIWAQPLQLGRAFGYALLITSKSITGAKLDTFSHALVRYVGPGSNVTQEDRNEAEGAAWEITNKKDFEISKDEITEIVYKKPGFFSSGHVVFNTAKEPVRLILPSILVNPHVSFVWKNLIRSLTSFAPDKLRNEKI
jgi:hypothetical protein